jgi:hypothetical protein
MLLNYGDACQWTYLRKLKKKNLDGGLEWKILKVPLQFPPPQICPITKHVYVSHKMKKLQGKWQTGGQIRNYTFGTGYIEERWPI